MKKDIVVAVSGGFDPIHIGHVRLFKEAKALGDSLIVILNNDNWLKRKKDIVFIPQSERKEILEAIRYVDEVIISHHKPDEIDMSVCQELQLIKPDYFANGGDRHADDIPELKICEEIGCKAVFNIGFGGKIQSSSWLLKKYLSQQSSAK